MRQDWEEKPLNEIGIAQTGTTPKTSEKENFGDFIPFIKPADVNFSGNGNIRYDNVGLSEIGLKKGREMECSSILMVCIGATIGKVGFAEMNVSCNQQINSLTVKKEFAPKLIYYAMTSISFQDKVLLEGKGSQATLPIINKSKWQNLTISYPTSLPEQKRIVAILDKAFAAIAKAKTNAEQNLKNAKELFENYLQGVFENKNEGWGEKRLRELVDNIVTGPFGSMLHKSDYVEDGIPVVNPQNIVDGQILPLQKTMINDETYMRLEKYSLKTDDIVIARRGEMGRCALVKKKNTGWLCGTGSFVIRVNKKQIDCEFLNIVLSSKSIKEQLQKSSIGATMSNLNQGSLLNLQLNIPPLSQQQTIVGQIYALSTETKKLEAIYQKRIEDLEELKKSILQKAFNGELTEKEMPRLEG